MNKYNLYTLKDNKLIDILEFCGGINWSTDSETVGMQLTFSSIKKLNFGNYINLKINDKDIFIGTVITIEQNNNIYAYTCMDFARYLNKNKTIMQFNNIPAWIAMGQVCSKFSIKHDIPHNIITKITKIYKSQTLLDIIKDIGEIYTKETGKKLYMEMDGDIFKVKNDINLLKISTKFLLGNGATFKESIENTITKVEVVSKDEKDTRIISIVEDKKASETFGLVTEHIQLEENQNESQAYNIAEKYLKTHVSAESELTLDIIPIKNAELLRANRLVDFKLEKYNINSARLITNCNCTLENGVYKASITFKW
ncbi:XkdQ/YqbQ family protein [Clostridium brassicae]|uniref:YqbQ/XkdQ domain-containing protein n=1 Tax=Clostridium brassicae TaxID=2999072 RepID=A0ABT4DAB2_9CLOT|nr:hypothetical protein [Clostridium brassicae]MCY6957964.1 hypothetical protein [Clostridium brassicae]